MVILTGCGGSQQVTYVDPNGPPGPADPSGATAQPIADHGIDVMARTMALVRLRAALVGVRTLAAVDPSNAGAPLTEPVERDLTTIEPRLHAADPSAARELRRRLETPNDTPLPNETAVVDEVRAISDGLLNDAYVQLIPPRARQDVRLRAVVLYETLNEAATEYESSTDEQGETITDADAYRRAYGLVVDASTRQLEAVPEDARPVIRAALDRIARRSFPGPTPPSQPRHPEVVLGELSGIADDVITAADVDPTYPTTDPATGDLLRALDRDVEAAVEAGLRGERTDAVRLLMAADRLRLEPAASGTASVGPDVLARIERGLLMDVRAALQSGRNIPSAAATLDADIDEAVALVEDELELLRQDGAT